MGLIETRLDAWPLVISVASGLSSLDQHVAYLEEWRNWFLRDERFAVLRIFEDEEALVHPDGSAQATKAWLRSGIADAIRQRVTAMVNVVPPVAYPRFAPMSIERTFGVPGLITADRNEACQWLAHNDTLGVEWSKVEKICDAWH
ncbi:MULTISPECIES: hypothetical protein [unclassified Sphingobium]|uniref:hypothetical protein n=1 Tax=unclassified Sphingobium TaxID=2611147 RepID=UPI000D16DB0C|nr:MULTISPECIES: hypothetical protein [unclassified Sphingobium]MBG6116610.1 hypothetical protein [Sphingobium sp. JAI105]PSO13075.1 hypothetical protein C7E20_04895 [Sphingobium sp. AEW4]TWD07202.1 hypothetical protein FB595_107151 [Sphingobium sp. AEW010]TWD24349.1 hypothetical protein FB596_10722 [Sphingobium sp. AEW013]TWD26180.1 hypothetical protein FB594_10722 [Sphingobium sp. AEW001]